VNNMSEIKIKDNNISETKVKDMKETKVKDKNTSEIKIKDKSIVVPGEELATGIDFLPSGGAYRKENKIISSKMGITHIEKRVIKVVPLTGRYFPKAGDVVIGKVAGISSYGWHINIGYAYQAGLNLRDATSDFIEKGSDLSQYYDHGDYIITKVTNVTKENLIDLSTKGPGLRRINEGKIIKIIPQKVPRVIGKQGSMISIVKEKTKCKITVGQNGLIWISGPTPEDELRATEAIREIEKKAHIKGLTEKITKYLEKKTSKKEA